MMELHRQLAASRDQSREQDYAQAPDRGHGQIDRLVYELSTGLKTGGDRDCEDVRVDYSLVYELAKKGLMEWFQRVNTI